MAIPMIKEAVNSPRVNRLASNFPDQSIIIAKANVVHEELSSIKLNSRITTNKNSENEVPSCYVKNDIGYNCFTVVQSRVGTAVTIDCFCHAENTSTLGWDL